VALDNVPWFLEQPGVAHPSSSARTVAWAATGGERGVIGAASLGVVAQSVPAGSVQVRPGGAVIPSTYAGAAQESYVVRNRTSTNVTIRPTGSGGGRHDAVICRIDDTGMAGAAPATPQTYDYAKLTVIEGVSASLTDVTSLNLGYPAIMLARIDIPASTGAITKAMITDVRHVAMSREETVRFVRPLIAADNTGLDLKLNSKSAYPAGEWWPNVGGEDDGGLWYADVPAWATRMQITAEWLGVRHAAGNTFGAVWIAYGPGAGSATPTTYTQAYQYDTTGSTNVYRSNLIVADEVALPASMRGVRLPIVLRGNVASASTAGLTSLDGMSGLVIEARFLERPDTDLQAD